MERGVCDWLNESEGERKPQDVLLDEAKTLAEKICLLGDLLDRKILQLNATELTEWQDKMTTVFNDITIGYVKTQLDKREEANKEHHSNQETLQKTISEKDSPEEPEQKKQKIELEESVKVVKRIKKLI